MLNKNCGQPVDNSVFKKRQYPGSPLMERGGAGGEKNTTT